MGRQGMDNTPNSFRPPTHPGPALAGGSGLAVAAACPARLRLRWGRRRSLICGLRTMTVLAGGGQGVVAPAAATEAASPGSAPLRLAAVNAPAQGGPSHCSVN